MKADRHFEQDMIFNNVETNELFCETKESCCLPSGGGVILPNAACSTDSTVMPLGQRSFPADAHAGTAGDAPLSVSLWCPGGTPSNEIATYDPTTVRLPLANAASDELDSTLGSDLGWSLGSRGCLSAAPAPGVDAKTRVPVA